jgi:general secretion pathway protein D
MFQFKYLIACLMMAVLGAHAQAPVAAAPASEAASAPQPRIIRGDDMVVAPASNAGQVTGIAAGLKFEDAPVADVVSLVLREIAKVDYIIHPPISGSVTLSTQGNVSADQAVLLLEAALQANGLQMARDTRGTYHIGRPDVIKSMVPAIRQATGKGPLPPGYGAILVPLKYIGAAEMASILRPMAAPDAIVRVDTVRNLLVMVGTRNQAEGWLDIVSTFDVDMLKGMSVGVFPLKHVSTSEIESALRLLSTGTGTGATAPTAQAPAVNAPGTAGVTSAASTSAGLASSFPLYGALRIVPIERINSVMVVTPRAAYLDEARRWIEKLDQPGGNSPEAQLFVYPVQNGDAKHLASVLNGLFGNGSAATTQQPATSGVAPGLKSTTAASVSFSSTNASTMGNSTGTQNANAATQGGGSTSMALNSGVRVMADDINNAVLVYGKRGEYEKIEATLKQLDVAPNQILIEASIIEVTLTDDLQYGLQWAFTDSARGSSGLLGTGILSTAASTAAGIAFGATPAGFSYTLRNSAGDVRAILNALAEKSLVKVISSPSLMVLDNHTASIVVGDQQPIQSGTTTTSGGNVTTSIEYKDTGVSLSVTPSVNAGNMVTMQLNQAVTDVGAKDTVTGQRSFLQRQFSSKVAVRSGESLVLGGLIRDNTSSDKTGLPVLQDIPLFGNLFGATTKTMKRTELVVVITPRVVRTEVDVREVGRELKDRMKMLYPPEAAQ